LADYYEATVRAAADAQLSASWITGPLAGLMNEKNCPIEDVPVPPEALADLLKLILTRSVSGAGAKTILQHMWAEKRSAGTLLDELDLRQQNNEQEVHLLVQRILDEHAFQVKAYQDGKKRLFGFFVGRVMQASGGKVNPLLVDQILKRELDNV
jgi:aspartyl-tRNA(Asn)/glutamyl-tRNA(Gln) amidotransferase subunit B